MQDAVEMFNEGLAHLRADELQLALEAFNTAIQLDPNLAKAYNGRALVHALNSEMNHAVADATEAIRLDPQESKFYRTRGLIYREIGNRAKAKSDLDRAEELG